MTNNQRFDEHIKDQFREYTPQVHPRIWENIIKEKEKRRPVGFWFNFFKGKNILLLTGLLVAAGTGAYVISNYSAKTNSTTPTTAIVADNKTPVQQTNASTAAETNATVADASSHNNTPALSETTNDNTATTNNNAVKVTLTRTASKSTIKLYSPFAEEDNTNHIAGNKKSSSKKSATNNDYDISDADIAAGNSTLQERSLSALHFIAEKNTTEKEAFSLHKNFLPNIFLPGCPSIEKDAAGNKAYVEIYAGPDMAFRSFSDTGNSAYLQKRKESTSFTSAYSAGLRYTRVFSNGMSVRTGINYSQINEKFTYVQGNLVQVTYIINANGDTTGTYVTTGTRYKTTHNKFRTIDVPLVMGYELGNGKIHANINAGIIVNAYSWQKGEVLDTAFRPVNINTGKSSSPYQFKTNIGLGFLAGASVYYKITEKAHLLAEPYFRYNLSPMSKENLTFKQKYNTAGLRLGLRIDLR